MLAARHHAVSRCGRDADACLVRCLLEGILSLSTKPWQQPATAALYCHLLIGLLSSSASWDLFKPSQQVAVQETSIVRTAALGAVLQLVLCSRTGRVYRILLEFSSCHAVLRPTPVSFPPSAVRTPSPIYAPL